MLKQLIMAMLVVVLVGGFTSTVQAASPPLQGEGQEYVVQSDDWLSKLAEKYLGDATSWNQIVEATNARAGENSAVIAIDNPDVIYPGQVIFIPAGNSTRPDSVEPLAEELNLAAVCNEQDPAVQAFCSEIPIAQIHFDPNEEAEFFTCASRAGLSKVQLDSEAETTILIPNDGDFDLRGITSAIKVTQDEAILIPRWPGSKFDFSEEFAEEFNLPVGEQLQIPLATALELVRAGELMWTGEHGEPGKAGLFQTNPPLRCDSQADFEIEIGPFNPTG